jgi:ABC-type branched-subunit amino acid transport system substrate-binding protein
VVVAGGPTPTLPEVIERSERVGRTSELLPGLAGLALEQPWRPWRSSSACSSGRASTLDRPRAAIVAPFSGPCSAWGALLLRAAVRRDDVDWLKVDDEGRAELGAACARRAIDARVAAVVGHFNSGGATLALPEYAAAGVACLLPLATAPGLTALAPGLVLRQCPTDDAQAQALLGAFDGAAVAVVDDASAYGAGLAARLAAAGAVRIAIGDAAGWHGALVVSAVHRAAAAIAREIATAGCRARLAFVDDCGDEQFAERAGDAAGGALIARFPDGVPACVDEMVDALADALTAGPAFRGRVLIDAIRASAAASYDARGERVGAAWDVGPLTVARA